MINFIGFILIVNQHGTKIKGALSAPQESNTIPVFCIQSSHSALYDALKFAISCTKSGFANAKRATLRTDSARRPLARTPVTKRALWVAWVDLGVLAMRRDCNPTQRVVVVVRFSQLRRPATLLPIPRHVLRVGAGIRAG